MHVTLTHSLSLTHTHTHNAHTHTHTHTHTHSLTHSLTQVRLELRSRARRAVEMVFAGELVCDEQGWMKCVELLELDWKGAHELQASSCSKNVVVKH